MKYTLSSNNAHIPIPIDVTELTVNNTQLTSLPPLPPTLHTLVCNCSQITSLPPLPPTLQELHCSRNQLTSLPPLPPTLKTLKFSDNQLTSLPPLPPTLHTLFCIDNNLPSLPPLPSTLHTLNCQYTQLTSLPPLPHTLQELDCCGNQLTSLPPLPPTLQKLYCGANPISICSLKDVRRVPLNKQQISIIAKCYRLACRHIARKEATLLIQRNLKNWIDKPITNDGRLGIAMRIGMRKCIWDFSKFNPCLMWHNDGTWRGEHDRDLDTLMPSL
jgi:Leucine-rich repeat (LRR) protein